MSVLLVIFSFILVVVCFLLCLVILMQKSKSDGGLGAALGGGMAESAFGAETNDVLSKMTIRGIVALFVISFGLYLGNLYVHRHAGATNEQLPTIPAAPSSTAPAAPQPPATAAPQNAAPATTGGNTTPAPQQAPNTAKP